MKALFRCEKNWQKINVQRFSANFLFSKNGKCRSITYSGDFATLPFNVATGCHFKGPVALRPRLSSGLPISIL